MESLWEYILIFLAAATPWLEAIIVVPYGVIRGFNPFLVSVIAFLGNMLTILLVVIFYHKISDWLTKRRKAKGGEQQIKRTERARRIWNKYGVPGLSAIGPLLIGTHFTILMALALGSNKKAATVWMAISLAGWIVISAVGSYYGFSWFKMLRG